MPLYLAMLFKEMKIDGSHEGCIEQLYRLFTEGLYSDEPRLDEEGRLRMDELEMRAEIQAKVAKSWADISTENLNELTDFVGYKHDFLSLFGFGVSGIDYDAEVDTDISIEHLIEGPTFG
jgi:enoyl-[acyl-carrier protein] reductase/trans-2-enoyl-CoA reductase (NAD+)